MKSFRIVLLVLTALAAGVLASADAQTLLWTLDKPDPPQAGADFGHSLAGGDVNGDGKADMAVGAPGEDVGGNTSQGRAYVFLGPGGLFDRHLDTPNPQAYASFGYSVAVGDVDGDGKADIAVGAPGQEQAHVFSGADGSLLFTLDTPNPQAGGFGHSLAVGDADGDGFADIAVGAPGEDVGGNTAQGRAYVFSGAECLLGPCSPLFTLDTPNPEAGGNFGYSLAVGDVDGDGFADIAVGAPFEDVGGNINQGRAYLFWGPDGWPPFTLDTPNPQEGAFFGWSLAAGEVNGDGFADIAVGAWLEDVGGTRQGRAYVFSGAECLLGPCSPLFTLDTPNPQEGALFGWSLAVGDVNGDHKADIAVGAPSEDVDLNENQGRAYVFSGADGSSLFTLDSPNPQPGAWFGESVAAADVNGDGGADVAVGVPREDVDGNADQGRAYVFLLGCEAGVHSDGDGFDDRIECYLGTDPLDNCPDDLTDDAWPPDMNHDTEIDFVDMFRYMGNIGWLYRDPEWSPAIQRLDLGGDGAISAVGDLLHFYREMGLQMCDGGTPQPPSWAQGMPVTMGIDPEITGNYPDALGEVQACWPIDVPSQAWGDDTADHTIDVYVTGDTPPPAPTGYDAWVIYDPARVDPVEPYDDLIKLPGATSYTTEMPSRLNAAAAYTGDEQGTAGHGTIVRIDLDVVSAGPACFVFGHAVAYASEALHPTTARVAMLAINEACPTQDSDRDGVFDICDNCPDDYNPSQRDFDGDGWADACDNCPDDYNPSQDDADGDDWGDTCDYCPTTATPWYVPAGDEDCDGFTTAQEEHVGTDPEDACPDVLGTPGLCPGPSCDGDDAWPPDLDVDREVDIADVMTFKPVILTTVPPSPQRFDLDGDTEIDIADIMKYKPVILKVCTP